MLGHQFPEWVDYEEDDTGLFEHLARMAPAQESKETDSSMEVDRGSTISTANNRPYYLTIDEVEKKPIVRVWRGHASEGANGILARVPDYVADTVDIRYPGQKGETTPRVKTGLPYCMVVFLDRRYFGAAQWPYTDWIRPKQYKISLPSEKGAKIPHFNQDTGQIVWASLLGRGWRFQMYIAGKKRTVTAGVRTKYCRHQESHSSRNPCIMVIQDGMQPGNPHSLPELPLRKPLSLMPKKKKRTRNQAAHTDESDSLNITFKSDIRSNLSAVLRRLSEMCRESEEVRTQVQNWYEEDISPLVDDDQGYEDEMGGFLFNTDLF